MAKRNTFKRNVCVVPSHRSVSEKEANKKNTIATNTRLMLCVDDLSVLDFLRANGKYIVDVVIYLSFVSNKSTITANVARFVHSTRCYHGQCRYRCIIYFFA